jgi:hypothetical protein
MKTRLFSALLAGMLLWLAPLVSVHAQGSFHDWSRVQAIKVDERLIVKQKGGKTLSGKMIEATENNLTFSRDGKVVNIPRSNVQQIEVSTGKASKSKWALIGAGVGAAAGGGIGAAKASSVSDDGGIYTVAGLIIGAGAGAATGAFIGANQRHREVIYVAP